MENQHIKLDDCSEKVKSTCVPFERTFRDERMLEYKVHGFWSSNYITCYKHMDGSWQISWSVGGRDSNEEPDDLKAIACFAMALKDASMTAKSLEDPKIC